MSSSVDPLDITLTSIYVLSLFSNALFILYLLVTRLRITVDRLVCVLCSVNLLLTLLAVPVAHEAWTGEEFTYSERTCRITLPIYRFIEYSQGFTFAAIAYFVARKLNGDQEVKGKVVALFVGLHVVVLLLTLPLFGVFRLVQKPKTTASSDAVFYCDATWPREAQIASLIGEVLMFVFSCSIAVHYFRKSSAIIRYINDRLQNQTSTARYQSFNRVMSSSAANVADGAELQDDNLSESHLRFDQSEEMNLEMNHLYQKQNTLSKISKNEEKANISVQIFSNEVEIDKIDRHAPLWRGPPRLGVLQKMVVSIKWFRYSCNLFKGFLVCFVWYAITALPYHAFHFFAAVRPPYMFNSTQRTVASVIFIIRLSTNLLAPWILMIGIFKFRQSLFGKCCRRSRNDFSLLPAEPTVISEET